MRQSDWTSIRALPLFCEVSDANFDELLGVAFLHRFPKNVSLINEGDMPDFLHIVVDGMVELFGSHNGAETTIDIVRPLTPILLAAVIRNAVYLKSARTLAASHILMIPAPTVRDLFRRDCAFACAIVDEIAERYRDAIRALKNVKLRTSPERLANWILQADALQGYRRYIELSIDKRTLASHLGMTPENLSRNLALLTQYGVRSSGRDIIIEDASALAQFAKPNALMDD
jgi:CRP/FNR family transcriptional activator FtrB